MCSGEDLHQVLSLGVTPLANAYLREAEDGLEGKYPLEVYFCRSCYHCQLLDVVSPEILYRDYLYASSAFSNALVRHFAGLAEELIRRQALTTGDLVVEIASNDGILLQEFKQRGIRALGVEPASNLVKVCRSRGLEAHEAFFSSQTARDVLRSYGKATVVTGSNVMGHVDEVVDFIAGVEELLTDDGIVSMEVPHVLDLVKNLEFDTIYHEHLSYFSVASAATLFRRAGLTLYDVQQVPIHGGTIRLFGKKAAANPAPSDALGRLLDKEQAAGLQDVATYEEFRNRVARIKQDLLDLLGRLKSEGKRLAAYGAAAKGATLLNYCGIDTRLLDYIADKSPYKQDLFAPGSHLPIVSPSRVVDDQPDYLLLLAWNFSEEIIAEQQEYLRRGGQFIIPLPAIRLVR